VFAELPPAGLKRKEHGLQDAEDFFFADAEELFPPPGVAEDSPDPDRENDLGADAFDEAADSAFFCLR